MLADFVPSRHTDELETRTEDPAVLWERSTELTDSISRAESNYPMPDLTWIEDRFWVWVHFAAAKLGRGELFEVIDFLSFLRERVLGPSRWCRQVTCPASYDFKESGETVSTCVFERRLGFHAAPPRRTCAR